jgi:hypothetical protein
MEQEQPDVELQHMEQLELEEELQAMDEEMEDAEPHRRRKKTVVDPEPLDDYPGGQHETCCCGGTMCTWPGRQLMARYLLVLNSFTLYLKLPVYILLSLHVYLL